MFKTKIASAVLLSALLLGKAAFFASASFGSGAAVIGADVSLIKSGLLGEKICFRDTDFKSALGVTDFKKITLTSLPKESDGILLYAGKRAVRGQTIKRRCIPSLVFLPASENTKEASFCFTAEGYADGQVIECVLRFCQTVNLAPSVSFPASSDFSSTQSGKISGTLYARDPEGDKLEFFVAAYPRHGSLTLGKDGSYTYTASPSSFAEDSFSYVVRDEWGNWSDVAKIELNP